MRERIGLAVARDGISRGASVPEWQGTTTRLKQFPLTPKSIGLKKEHNSKVEEVLSTGPAYGLGAVRRWRSA